MTYPWEKPAVGFVGRVGWGAGEKTKIEKPTHPHLTSPTDPTSAVENNAFGDVVGRVGCVGCPPPEIREIDFDAHPHPTSPTKPTPCDTTPTLADDRPPEAISADIAPGAVNGMPWAAVWGDPGDWSEAEREALQERAAVREFDGGMSRDAAERAAVGDIRPTARPGGLIAALAADAAKSDKNGTQSGQRGT